MRRKNISIRLDPELTRKYKIWLAKKGLSQQKHLEDFIKREVGEMRWEAKGSVKEVVLKNINEIIDAMVEKYVPRFLVSLAYDEENKKLFVTEPYTTSTRLPWRVLVTVDDKDFDVEGVILDTDLAADAIIEKDDYTYAGEAAHREMVKENLWEFIREEIDNLVDGLEEEV